MHCQALEEGERRMEAAWRAVWLETAAAAAAAAEAAAARALHGAQRELLSSAALHEARRAHAPRPRRATRHTRSPARAAPRAAYPPHSVS